MGVGPVDEVPEGISFDLEKPKYRCFRKGESVLEYTLEDGELTVDWVNGKNVDSMLLMSAQGSEKGAQRKPGIRSESVQHPFDSVRRHQ